MDETTIILLALPVAGLQLVLMVVNLINWSRKTETKRLNRTWWLLIIVLGALIGNIAYLALESEKHDSD